LFTFGTKKRIYIHEESGDALFATVTMCGGVGDIRVVLTSGAGPVRRGHHYSMPALIGFAEPVWLSVASVAVSPY